MWMKDEWMEEKLIIVISRLPILYDMILSSYQDKKKTEANVDHVWKQIPSIVGMVVDPPETNCPIVNKTYPSSTD